MTVHIEMTKGGVSGSGIGVREQREIWKVKWAADPSNIRLHSHILRSMYAILLMFHMQAKTHNVNYP